MGHATRSIQEAVPPINNPEDLAKFASDHNLRPDWHEPDEQGVEALWYGERLDNAMGAGWMPDTNVTEGEVNVILLVNGKREAVVNLADLLAWAAQAAQAVTD
jgi:hypothetical protein